MHRLSHILPLLALPPSPQTNPKVLVDANAIFLLDFNFDVLLYDKPQLIEFAMLAFDYFNLPVNFNIPRVNLRNFVTAVSARSAPLRPPRAFACVVAKALHPTGAVQRDEKVANRNFRIRDNSRRDSQL